MIMAHLCPAVLFSICEKTGIQRSEWIDAHLHYFSNLCTRAESRELACSHSSFTDRMTNTLLPAQGLQKKVKIDGYACKRKIF